MIAGGREGILLIVQVSRPLTCELNGTHEYRIRILSDLTLSYYSTGGHLTVDNIEVFHKSRKHSSMALERFHPGDDR